MLKKQIRIIYTIKSNFTHYKDLIIAYNVKKRKFNTSHKFTT